MINLVVLVMNTASYWDLLHAVFDDVPPWFITGVMDLDPDDDPMGNIRVAYWSEGKLDPRIVGAHTVINHIPDTERERVLKKIAAQAVKVCTLPENIADIGEALLDKHPECRKAEDTYTAIIEAALAERKAMFTEDMYVGP